MKTFALVSLLLLLAALPVGCGERLWNDPYTDEPGAGQVLFSSFSARPKHLDPVRSYSANEYAFIAQIYEPPLQYHFLDRPYRLIALSAEALPTVRQFTAEGTLWRPGMDEKAIAFSEYEVKIRPGIHYQPHPAFARGEGGEYLYHALDGSTVADAHTLSDFPKTGSREVVAADFVHQIKRIGFSRLHSPIRGLMTENIDGLAAFGEAVEAAYQVQQQASSGESRLFDLRPYPISGVKVIDRYRFSIRLRKRYPQFVYWLAMPFFAPMPWEAERFYGQPGMKERNITLDWYPVGSGPFMLTENNPNLRMVLERNPNFHRETYPESGEPQDAVDGLLVDAGRELPLIDKAVYSLEKESIPRWNKFLQGWYDASGIGSDSFDQAVQFGSGGEAALTEAMREREIRLVTAVEASIYYLGINMLDPVLGGDGERARLLRQAISIAVDFEEYISIFLNGRGVVAHGPLPPGIYGHLPGEEGVNHHVYHSTEQGPRRRSLEEAKQLLARAGYPGGQEATTGKPLTLYYDTTATGPDDKARLNWMRKQFARLGVELVIRATDYNRFQEKMRKGTAQIFMWGWNADYPDPENFFFLLYGANGKVEHGGENAANYANPEFDRLFDEMKNLANGPRRLALIRQMNEILRRDAPWSWGFFPKAYSLHHGWYGNVKPNLMANNTLKYKRIDAEQRAAMRQRWNQPVLWPLALGGGLLALFGWQALRLYRARERSRAR